MAVDIFEDLFPGLKSGKVLLIQNDIPGAGVQDEVTAPSIRDGFNQDEVFDLGKGNGERRLSDGVQCSRKNNQYYKLKHLRFHRVGF